MKEMELKYGCNPNQKPSRVFTVSYTHLDVYKRQNEDTAGEMGGSAAVPMALSEN